ALSKQAVKLAPLTTDEQFLRRVTLDLVGELPVPADVRDFLADKNPDKRAKLIDKLLASEEYSRHWARYWRGVISSRVTDNLLNGTGGRPFELWMTEQLKKNRSWGEVAREMLTATGPLRFDKPTENGHAYLVGSRRGADATTEIAAEVSRIFLG